MNNGFNLFTLATLLCGVLTYSVVDAAAPVYLKQVIKGEQRSEKNRTRDQARHPLQTLNFFGVTPNATVIEIWPGSGWYTEILAPYLKQGGGQFTAAGFSLTTGAQWRQNLQQRYQDRLATQPAYYDQVAFIPFGPPDDWSLGESNSTDFVLTFRNVHNWVKGEFSKEMFAAIYQVLKPGGILGITDHRAKPDTDLATMKQSGYMTEALVIKLATQAGFKLVAKSEINANAKDTKNYEKGVWTLPPMLRLGDKDRAKYLHIGESDRMTLKFKK